VDPFEGHADRYRPLEGYATLIALYGALMTAFLAVAGRRDRLPGALGPADAALLGTATFRLSRLMAKDRVTSVLRAPFTRFQEDSGEGEVEEAARGRGLRRAVGELLVCPVCLAQWTAGGLLALFTFAPRTARTVSSLFVVVTVSDLLQMAYSRLKSAAR
jgi:hypothetical protein